MRCGGAGRLERVFAARSRERAYSAVVVAPLQPPPADAQRRVPEAQELGGGERFGRRAVVAAAAQERGDEIHSHAFASATAA